jgi:hypothetical protein
MRRQASFIRIVRARLRRRHGNAGLACARLERMGAGALVLVRNARAPRECACTSRCKPARAALRHEGPASSRSDFGESKLPRRNR